MTECPKCGQENPKGEKYCEICNSVLSVAFKAENDSGPISKNDEKFDRQRWLEQQKAHQNELTGLKETYKDELEMKKEKEELSNLPLTASPYPSSYLQRPVFGTYGRNYRDATENIQNILQSNLTPSQIIERDMIKKEAAKSLNESIAQQTLDQIMESDSTEEEGVEDESELKSTNKLVWEDDPPEKEANNSDLNHAEVNDSHDELNSDLKPETSDVDEHSENKDNDIPFALPVINGDDNTPIIAELEAENKGIPNDLNTPSKIHVESKDLIKVDSVIENNEELSPRKDTNLAGAIDRILSHEKMYHSKTMTLKLSTPMKIAAPSKRHHIDEILKNLDNSITNLPKEFKIKPVKKLLNRVRRKLTEGDIDLALSLAQNANETYNRLYEHYKNAIERLNNLEIKIPAIKDTNHRLHRKYKKLLSSMKSGQYFQVTQNIAKIEDELGEITRTDAIVSLEENVDIERVKTNDIEVINKPEETSSKQGEMKPDIERGDYHKGKGEDIVVEEVTQDIEVRGDPTIIGTEQVNGTMTPKSDFKRRKKKRKKRKRHR